MVLFKGSLLPFTAFHLPEFILLIVVYFLDLISDIIVAICHYCENSSSPQFFFTLLFLILPAFAINGYSWLIFTRRLSLAWNILKIIFHIFHQGFLFRFIKVLWYAWRGRKCTDQSKEQEQNYDVMAHYAQSLVELHIIHAFTQSFPQAVTQLSHILSKTEQTHTSCMQWVSIAFSVLSIVTAMILLEKKWRNENPYKIHWFSIFGSFGVVFSLWRLFITVSRILAVALFATICPVYLILIFGIRWVFSSIFCLYYVLCHEDRQSKGFLDILKAVFHALVHVIHFVNPHGLKPTRLVYLLYYTYTFIENSIMVGIWYARSDPDKSYHLAAFLAHYCMFFFGLMYMVIYYLLLHPNDEIPIWLSLKESLPKKHAHQSLQEDGNHTSPKLQKVDIVIDPAEGEELIEKNLSDEPAKASTSEIET